MGLLRGVWSSGERPGLETQLAVAGADQERGESPEGMRTEEDLEPSRRGRWMEGRKQRPGEKTAFWDLGGTRGHRKPRSNRSECAHWV